MTATPESWDDVGSLRLEVGCISQKVEAVQKGLAAVHGLNDSQLQQLRHDVALILANEQEQKKERCQMKVCIVITATLFCCILAMQIIMTFTGSASRLSQSRLRLSDEAWKTNLDDFQPRTLLDASASTNTLVPVKQANKGKQRNIKLGQQQKQQSVDDAITLRKPEKELLSEQHHLEREDADERKEEMMSRHKHAEEAQSATEKKHGTSLEKVEKRVPHTKQAPEHEVQSAPHPQSSAAGSALNVTKSSEADHRKDAKEDAEDANAERENDKELLRDHPRDKGLSPAFDLGATVLEDPEKEGQESVKATQDDSSSLADHMRSLMPLPFQVMSNRVLNQSSHGVFWVCFPSGGLEKNVKKYTPVFNEVARSWKWRAYPFCYLDTTRLRELYYYHFCDDGKKLVFVMEKKRNVVPDDIDRSSSRSGIPTDSLIESPAWFRRVFRADQDIQVSLVEDFLNDVHSGKVPEVIPPKEEV